MSPSRKILQDLEAGQSTADSIASRVQITTPVVTIILQGLQADGLVRSTELTIQKIDSEFEAPVPTGLLVWKLAPQPAPKTNA